MIAKIVRPVVLCEVNFSQLDDEQLKKCAAALGVSVEDVVRSAVASFVDGVYQHKARFSRGVCTNTL